MVNHNTKKIDERSSPEQRAFRLKCLREMTGLSREGFRKRYGVARGTLQNWETARFGGLTEKGSQLLIRYFTAESISCSLDWLLHGIGSSPRFDNELSSKYNPSVTQPNIPTLCEELLYFRQNNSHSIDYHVVDDSMKPKFNSGIILAGIKEFQDNINKTLWNDCIVQTLEYGTLFRFIRPGSKAGRYHLYSHNITSHAPNLMLHDVEVISSAMVCWLRSPDPLEKKEAILKKNSENGILTEA